MIQATKHSKSGFALLISIIVVGVVVSVGLSILELTIKQLALATNSKDSETALHAANAGLECAQYWRNKEYKKFEEGDDDEVVATCFGTGSSHEEIFEKDEDIDVSDGEGSVYKYTAEFDWGAVDVDARCSLITMIVMMADSESSDPLKIDDISDYISGYDIGESKECEPGGICTLTSVQGYNKSCGEVGEFGTIQREVLLES